MYSLDVKSRHPIECTQKILGFLRIRKRMEIRVSTSSFDHCGDMPDVKSDLGILGVNAAHVLGYHFVRMDVWPGAGYVFLHVYLVDNGKEKFRTIQIMDFFVEPKHRDLGIGTELMLLITKIANKNSARIIFGVLEANGDLEARKRFFTKNDFELVENRNLGLSCICAMKLMNYECLDESMFAH